MKILNLIAVITFAVLSVLAIVVGLVQKRYELLALALIFTVLSRISYLDYKDERKL